ncbi:DUF429 domain-containing protein [Motilibacter aurantiacus]|uniref:DUF429 domain-containing protein n=1 Tax=Motilibacter aurantiacus TaxID=2714955 RepID=UPI002F2B3B58
MVLGADACKGGWVGVVLGDGPARALFGRHIGELVERAGPPRVVAVDIPIGLPTSGRRRADADVARALGPRRSSVFRTPVRAALDAATYAQAAIANRQLAGEGVAAQAYALREKVLEVDGWLRDGSGCDVREAHPELSFAALAGAPLAYPKRTWNGMTARRRLLAGIGIALGEDLGEAGARAAVDDVLDAAAVAWTASRVAAGSARSYPDPPEVLEDGTACAIWC